MMALSSVFLLSSCSTNEYEQVIKEKGGLFDPDSVKFRDVKNYGGIWCGQLNAKNRMGGYIGYTRFMVEEGGSWVEPTESDENDKFGIQSTGFSLAWISKCNNDIKSDDAVASEPISKKEIAAESKLIKFSPGEWENKVAIVDVKFDESKLPPGSKGTTGAIVKEMIGQVQTSKNCLTKEQAKKPGADFLAGTENDDCTYKKLDLSGGKINANIACKGKEAGQRGDIKLTGSYTPTSYDMQMAMVMNSPQTGSMTIKAINSAKRIGECKG